MTPQRLDTDEFDDVLIEIDYPIIRVLNEEVKATPGYISNEIGEPQPNVSKRLSHLIEEDIVQKVHWGLYELDDSILGGGNND